MLNRLICELPHIRVGTYDYDRIGRATHYE